MPEADDAARTPVRVLMVAIGGYGYYYLRTLLDEVPRATAVLSGVVDPAARASRAWPDVEASGVPVTDTVEDFFARGGTADLAVIVSPLHLHVPQSIAALEAGAAVLCDKPLGVTVQQGLALAAARNRARRPVWIGYQWSYSSAIQGLKADLLTGLFGRPLRFTTLCAWPRTPAYYARNSWAGRLRDAETGALVLDSPANNAMAHFLHNACYLLGASPATSAAPLELTAELYRANAIESADTVALRASMDNGCDVVFLASHATASPIAPTFRLECEHATVTFGCPAPTIVATFVDGTTKAYGDPDATPQFTKLDVAIDGTRARSEPVCGVEAALPQTRCVTAMHVSVPEIATFPSARVSTGMDGAVAVDGLGDTLLQCFEAGCLPHESGAAWARAGVAVNVAALSDTCPTPTHAKGPTS
jgi:predicted dehydrogenase